jgi:hypothetical protein
MTGLVKKLLTKQLMRSWESKGRSGEGWFDQECAEIANKKNKAC